MLYGKIVSHVKMAEGGGRVSFRGVLQLKFPGASAAAWPFPSRQEQSRDLVIVMSLSENTGNFSLRQK